MELLARNSSLITLGFREKDKCVCMLAGRTWMAEFGCPFMTLTMRCGSVSAKRARAMPLLGSFTCTLNVYDYVILLYLLVTTY